MYVYVIMTIILHIQIYFCIWCVSYFSKKYIFCIAVSNFSMSKRTESLSVRGPLQNSKGWLNYKNKKSKIYLAKYNIDKNSRLFVRKSKVRRTKVWKEDRRHVENKTGT